MHHTLDICNDIAKKLSDSCRIIPFSNQKIEEKKHVSWAWGLSGIACFYAMMHANFEHDRWDNVAHEYLMCIKQELESITYQNASLFNGLAGLSFSVLLNACGGQRYSKFLSSLDDLLLNEIEREFLSQVDRYLDPLELIPPHFYNLANGLGGIVSYLLCRENMKQTTYRCTEALVKVLSTTKQVNTFQVFPWYQPLDPNMINESNSLFKQGYYSLEVPYGIPGSIAVLSIAAKKGYQPPGLFDLIAKTTEWIMQQQVQKDGLTNWNRFIPLDPAPITPEPIEEIFGNNWVKGAPGISRCLFIGAQALKNHDLLNFSEVVFLAQIQNTLKHKNSIDTSFSLGKAGLLLLTYQMACDTQKPIFFKMVQELENDLKICYSPQHEFGFQSLAFINDNEPQWIDNPFLCNGASGIALSLLQTQGRLKMPWNPF